MKYIRSLLRYCIVIANLLIGAGFLFSAYSPYISPVDHPVQACMGLVFPIFLLLNLCFLLFWLFVKISHALIPISFLLLGWNSLTTYFAIGSTKEAQGTPIKLLTYNIQGKIVNSKTEKIANNPILHYLEESNADIICLQEFVPKSKRELNKVESMLSKYPYKEYTHLKSGNGLACFSRFPILSTQQIPYESWSNGSVMYHIKVGKDTLLLVNNHLESNKMNSHDKEIYNKMLARVDKDSVKNSSKLLLHKLAEAVAIRAPQADSVAQAIRQNRTKYILVCGDFNDSPLSYAHHTISNGLNDAYAEAGFGPGITYNQSHMYFRIDHIFTSPAFRILQCKVDRSIRESDHYPMWCIFEKSAQ